MHTNVTLVLRDSVRQIRLSVPMEQMQTVSVVVFKGQHYSYNVFKPHQNELHFSSISAPLELDADTPEAK